MQDMNMFLPHDLLSVVAFLILQCIHDLYNYNPLNYIFLLKKEKKIVKLLILINRYNFFYYEFYSTHKRKINKNG